jgi:hypothetical protein
MRIQPYRPEPVDATYKRWTWANRLWIFVVRFLSPITDHVHRLSWFAFFCAGCLLMRPLVLLLNDDANPTPQDKAIAACLFCLSIVSLSYSSHLMFPMGGKKARPWQPKRWQAVPVFGIAAVNWMPLVFLDPSCTDLKYLIFVVLASMFAALLTVVSLASLHSDY